MPLTLDQAMLIYKRTIDNTADAGEGAASWAEVQAELEAVIAAPTTAAAAALIAWWHQVWKDVGDTPARAASRIRRHAASVLGTCRKKLRIKLFTSELMGPAFAGSAEVAMLTRWKAIGLHTGMNIRSSHKAACPCPVASS